MCLGKEKIADLLIEYGANVNAVDNQGYTPLILTAEFGNFEIYIQCAVLVFIDTDIFSVGLCRATLQNQIIVTLLV